MALLPNVVNANPSATPAAQQEILYNDNSYDSHEFVAGNITSGEVEGFIQVNKSQVIPFVKVYFKLLYLKSVTSGTAPVDYPATKGDCGLHTILTKGP